MTIGNIEVHAYRKLLGGSQSQHNSFATTVKSMLVSELKSIDIRKIDVYNINHEQHSFNAGHRDRLVIFANGTYTGTTPQNEEYLGFTGIEGNTLIKTQNGEFVLAEYSKEKNELNILFDVFKEYTTTSCALFKYIMQEFERLVWFPKTLENSWKHTSDKNALTSRFTERLKRQAEQQLESDNYRLRESEQRIEDYKRQIKRDWDNVIRLRRTIETEMSNLGSVNSKLIADLDLIVQHERIADLHIINGILHVWTDDIYCYADNDKRYYIGKMKFTIDMENTDVKFFNTNNARNGFWTSEDPHPHVDGGNGHACLGNVASTIAELCAMNEAYALTMMCIDFLENANTSDPAGAKVRNWDEVDEEGNIIQSGGESENDWTCDHCDGTMHEDDESYTVYSSYRGEADGQGTWGDERTVCDECRHDYYTYEESLGEAVRDGYCDIDERDEEDDF